MMHEQVPLSDLSESELIWISGFADILRKLSPALAADGHGKLVDSLAREAFEDETLRLIPPAQAAPHWWAQRQTSMR